MFTVVVSVFSGWLAFVVLVAVVPTGGSTSIIVFADVHSHTHSLSDGLKCRDDYSRLAHRPRLNYREALRLFSTVWMCDLLAMAFSGGRVHAEPCGGVGSGEGNLSKTCCIFHSYASTNKHTHTYTHVEIYTDLLTVCRVLCFVFLCRGHSSPFFSRS